MDDKQEYVTIFLTESSKTEQKIEELNANFANVEPYPFSIPTINHGSVNVTLVWYSSPKDVDYLFSEDEYNMIYKINNGVRTNGT